jgi:hypothetical protein
MGALLDMQVLAAFLVGERSRGIPCGLIANVSDHLGDEARLDADAHALGRSRNCPLELPRGERHDRLGPPTDQFGEAAVPQRTVVEVGPQRDDEAQPACRVGQCGHQGVQEMACAIGGGERA